MPSWLTTQRKPTLVDLAREAGLAIEENARKEEIVKSLDTHLLQNATRFANNPAFEGYYGTRRTPGRPRQSSAAGGVTSGEEGDVKSVVRGGGRRPTTVKHELGHEEQGAASSPSNTIASPSGQLVTSSTTATSTGLTKRTPGRPRRRSELPPSPADVADDVEYATNQLYAGLDDFYSVSGIPETIDHIRDLCSSVTGIQLTCLLLEAFGLQRTLLPWTYAFDTPTMPIIGSFAVWLPDLFRLLEPTFWSTTMLWAGTSVLIPALFAYFYNLTTYSVKRHGVRATVARYTVDPMTFNIVKALLVYLVYGDEATLIRYGFVNEMTAARVDYAMYGGHRGVMTGSSICILASLYEAAQGR